MPARKSCASRIIGDRAVRPIAVSTSFSTAASEPSTISSTTGSTPSTASVLIGSLPRSPAGCRTGRRVAAKPGCSGTVEPNSSTTAGPVDLVVRREVGPPVDRGVHPVVEEDRPYAGTRPLAARPPAGGSSRSRGRSIGPTPVTRRFTHSTGCRGSSPERVAVELLVRVVERVGDRGGERVVDRPVRRRHPHLERLPEVAQVGACAGSRCSPRAKPSRSSASAACSCSSS